MKSAAMIYLDPRDIFCRSFFCTETSQPEWEEEIPHWQSYVECFFASNGLTLTDKQKRVSEWINSPERAAFSDMVLAILPEARAAISPARISTVLMAHWTPDLHMGTSVVNAAIHALGLADCLALAISDRGPDAGLFALDGLQDCLAGKNEDGLLLIAEQKNLMYHSPLMAQLQPENTACVCVVNTQQRGLRYRGYKKVPHSTLSPAWLEDHLIGAGLAGNHTTIIGPAHVLEAIKTDFHTQAHKETLLCAAPFAALKQHWQPARHYVLISEYQGECSLSTFAAAESCL